MIASTSLHSNAFNFLSYVNTGTDPRTGLYTCTISLPALKTNFLSGPEVPLQLRFSPLNIFDTGLGLGWDLQLSQYNPANLILSLSTGETFCVTGSGPQPDIREKKLDSFHFFNDGEDIDGQYVYRVVHKSGLVEILTADSAGKIALPRYIRSPQGLHVQLNYVDYGDARLLASIDNADGTRLLSLERKTDTVTLTVHPDTAYQARFLMHLQDRQVRRIELPTGDQASWHFKYYTQPEGGLRIIEVKNPVGAVETITYAEIPHYFPGLEGRTLARVAIHHNDPGFDSAIETRYTYPENHHNFLGYGSNVVWRDDNLDNLYRAADDYVYSSTEQLWDVNSDSAFRSTTRTFNRFHLMTVEEIVQNDNVLLNETVYHLRPDTEFEHQPPYCQLPHTTTRTWHSRKNPEHKRAETVTTTYDDWGNLLTQINANGVTETSEWYGRAAEDGCPADPQGFVRNLKRKTVTPAPSDYGQAPVLQTHYRYTEQRGLSGVTDSRWLALSEETLLQVGNEATPLQHSLFSYIDEPDNPVTHGRTRQEAVTLNGKTTTTNYAYSLPSHARTGESVLQTVSELVGCDGQVKEVTLRSSLFHAEPLNQHDENDVEIETEYDLVGRATKETVAPNSKDYKASRNYTYQLAGGVAEQAMQCAIDVKDVETRTYLDGFNRVIKEMRRDADGLGGDSTAFRETYKATYNKRGQLLSETVIDWERAENKPLTSRFNYDDWGERRSTIRPDGVEEHEVSDPIKLTVTQWLEGMGKTVTTNNLFEKPVSVKRFEAGIDPDAPGARPYSEHTYFYDGIGRTAAEYDAEDNVTSYEYDVFDRMTQTVLPDGYVVEREYAIHSSKDLPVKISVNGKVLGEQRFDGIDRMYESITGGRKSVYTFDPGQRQPKSVKRPSGVETGYVYRPELGEDPERRIAVESTATYTYDGQNARLLKTEEVDEAGITHGLEREYFSTGELKLEKRLQGEESLCMAYEYSRQARLIGYTDVLGNTQKYVYGDFSRLIATELGSTRSTFDYNELGLLQTIETIDGQQKLKIDLKYDDFGREVLRSFDLGNEVLQTLSQSYDRVDRLTQRILKQGAQTLRDETFGYDERGHLVVYTCSGSQPPEDPYGKPIKSQIFGFDAQDNITFLETSFEGGTHTINYEYGNQADPCQLTGLTNLLNPAEPGNPNYPERIDFTYDPDGNLLQDEVGRLLGYDSLGRLITVSAASGESGNEYYYDPLDTLSGSRSGSENERRFYRNGELANQLQGDNSSTFMRGQQMVLAERKEGADPKSLLLASDDKNSVLAEITRDGRVKVAFSPYGHRPHDSAVNSQLSYNGELREMQTGWYILGDGYRAFNPLLMRFHSPDSWSPFGEGGLNTYAYCLGNPIRFRDDSGHVALAKLFVVLMSGVGDDVTRMGANMGRTAQSGRSLGRTVQSGSSSAGGAARPGTSSMATVTDDFGNLTVSSRASRPTARHEPLPDYDSAGSGNEATVRQASSDVPKPTKNKAPKWKKNNPEHNIVHFPEAYKKAVELSKEGTVIRPHETITGASWVTGKSTKGTDLYFGTTVRNEIVRLPGTTKGGPKDRFAYNV